MPGVLAGIVARAKGSSLAAGRALHEVMIGAETGREGHFFVQVTFQGAAWHDGEPDED